MKLETLYTGDDLFEGDRVIWLRALPAGARVTAATATLSPQGGPGFTTAIDLQNGTGPWGTTATAGSSAQPEVDFHARRTLTAITGTGGAATLQIDLGGVYAGIASDGTLMAPGKTALTLTLNGASQSVPSLTLNKFMLMGTSLTISSVTVRAVPSNLTLRVGGLPPFWTRLGELTQPETSLDFSAVLNAALLLSTPESGFHQLAFMLHTDSLARLTLRLSVTYVIDAPVLPPHLNEVTLPYSFSTLPGVDQGVLTARLPRDAQPVIGQSQAAVRGQFQPTRIASGPIGAEPTTTPVVVSPRCSLAQWLRPAQEIALTGLDLPLGSTTPGLSGMRIAVHADEDGKPSNEVLTQADVRVDKPLPGQSSWGSVSLSAPYRLEAGHAYWLVLQSRAGDAAWNAEAAPAGEPPLQCTADGGLSWRAATVTGQTQAFRARFRLRQTPETYRVPIQVQIGAGPGAVIRRLDEYAPLGRIEFHFDFSRQLRDHLDQTRGDAPCGGELIRNGRFDLPAHDDASGLLLNLDDPSQGRPFDSNGVDLSRQRIVTVKIHNEDLHRIDCAGLDPAHTRLEDVLAAGRIGAMSNVFFADDGELGLSAIAELAPWCRETVPAEWLRLSGHVYQVRVAASGSRQVGQPSQTVIFSPVVLVSPPAAAREWLACQPDEPDALAAPSVLVQTVDVRAGCRYALSFYYLRDEDRNSGEKSAVPEACRWDVLWLDAAGRRLGQTGGPLAGGLDASRALAADVPGWQPFTTPISPPAGAVRAQVTFTRQPDGLLALEAVSLVATAEVLDNGDFIRATPSATGGRQIDGWTHAGDVGASSGRVRLRGEGDEAAVISQRVPVTAGVRYTLRVQAQSTRVANDEDLDRARVDVFWRAGEAVVGEPVVIVLDDRSFPTRAWSGPAPAGSTAVEVRVTQPVNGGSLLVRRVTLTEADEVAVPIVPLAESPGELTLTALHIAYDQVDTRPPAVERVSVLPRGRPMAVPVPALPAPAPAGPPAPVVAPVSANSPLTAVAGIGSARERELRALGITTLGQLAAARPALVARMRGVSPAMARQYIAQARRLLRNPA